MTDAVVRVIGLVAAIGSGLIGGVFFAFSTTVMKSLQVLPPAHGITAMQAINAKIVNPRFVLVFVATTLACALLAVAALFTSDQPGSVARGVGGLLYVVGVFGVTAVANVPLNNALDNVDPASQDGVRYWEHFLRRWMRWHYVRTVAAAAAATTLTVALPPL